MREREVCFIKRDVYDYPDGSNLFRPSVEYPEYPFKAEISNCSNDVYDMVREGLHLYGLDDDHYGSEEWNPLGEYIVPGNKVVIKPNLVLHRNENHSDDEKCLYTNPAVTAAIIDYTIIALKGRGEIIVGDAPLQECVFEILIEESGYDCLIEYYKNKGINISLQDFRNTKTVCIDEIRYPQHPDEVCDHGMIVKIDEDSAFAEFSNSHLEKLRVHNFDPRILQQHHHDKTHEYMIAKEILFADVVINMPKPKTHRKAGVTISLKNLIGINANKEFLPHHAVGGKEEGGDAYYHKNMLLTQSNEALDEKNILIAENDIDAAKEKQKEYWDKYQEGRIEAGERYWDGSWYGNDTIWRTISDLNRILCFAGKDGVMKETKQRKIFIVADMIIGGHKEGPLAPTSIKSGTIAIGENPLYFDRAVCSVMGIDYQKVPALFNEYLVKGRYRIADDIEPTIISNWDKWNKRTLREVRENSSLEFIPSAGWEVRLGNPKKERFLSEIEKEQVPVYIFGAGKYGTDMYLYLKDKKIKNELMGFFDNDPNKWNRKIIGDGYCKKPENVNNKYICVIAVTSKYMDEIKKCAEECGFRRIFCWDEDE